MTTLIEARRRMWRSQLFALGFDTEQLDMLIELRECYQRGRMIDGKPL